jgi:hypothetical protein
MCRVGEYKPKKMRKRVCFVFVFVVGFPLRAELENINTFQESTLVVTSCGLG